jgi:hypothetical protein
MKTVNGSRYIFYPVVKSDALDGKIIGFSKART